MNTQALVKNLQPIYGKKETDELIEKLKELPHRYEAIIYKEPNPYWYKYINLYIVYPDAFYSRQGTPLEKIKENIPRIREMGCTALHILPFLDSPLVDKGFDVRDFYTVRAELGHLNTLRDIVKEARNNGMRVFMDLVFNHVSEQHTWFQLAQEGNEEYREMFIYSKKKPEFVRQFDKDAAVWAEFMVDGKKKVVNIAFPEFCGEIPLWRKGKDGYWYYHTYYPQQPDLNWFNPNVFYKCAKIVFFWTSLGFNFRLDAIPFIGQKAYKNPDNVPETTHNLVSSLRMLAQTVNPECAFIVETYEPLSHVLTYFGTTNSKEAQLSYNFHLATYLWVGLLEKNADYIWNKLAETSNVPKHAEWVNFLRNHDELSLAYLDDAIKDKVTACIGSGGIPFRKGHGIAGRTRSLLGNDIKRFLMAYTLLASLPGGMGFVYGDEYGVKNIPLHKLSNDERIDVRNINRGKLSTKMMASKTAANIVSAFTDIVKKRDILKSYMNIVPQRIQGEGIDTEVFAAKYCIGISELRIYINLSEHKKVIPLAKNDWVVIKTTNGAFYKDKIVLESYGCIWVQC